MPAAHAAAAVVFAATFALLAVGRIGARALPRGPVALAGGLATMLLVGVSWRAIDLDVIALLAGLMLLAGLAAEAGLFAGVRRRLMAQPPARALWLALALMAGTSAALLNDAAVVVLVPFLWPALRALGLPPVPTLTLLAVAANVGSLLTPFGNPQNAVLARIGGLGLWDFVRTQGPLVALGMAALAIASRVVARGAVPAPELAPPPAASRGRLGIAAAVAGFLALAAWGVPAGVAAVVAAGAAAALAWAAGLPVARVAARSVDLNVLALFVGLYLLTAGLPAWLDVGAVPVAALGPLGATGLVVAASNAIGNVPAILSLAALDPVWTASRAHFLVATSTLGGALLLSGSAASLLAAEESRRFGVELRFVPFLRTAVPVVIPLLVVAVAWTWR